MTIQPIGAASVALYLTPDDLREHGLTPRISPRSWPSVSPESLFPGWYLCGGHA